MQTAQPAVDVPSLLTPEAAALFPQTLTRCHDRLSRPDSFGGLPLNQVFRSGSDLAQLVAVIAANDPESVRPRGPVRIDQGDADTTVFKAYTDQLADEYEASGVDLTYAVYPGVGHGAIVDAGAAAATRWIRARFR